MENEEVLKKNGGKKFDICLMNPPYDHSLWIKFVNKAIELSNTVIDISPNTLTPYSIGVKLFRNNKDTFNKLVDFENIDHDKINDYFQTGHSIDLLGIYVFSDDREPLNLDDIIYKKDETLKSITEKLFTVNYPEKLGWENKNTKRHGEHTPYRVGIYRWHGGLTAYETCINDSEKATVHVYFDNENQVKNFKNSFKTNFMEFYVHEYVVKGNGSTDRTFMFDKKIYDNVVYDDFFFDFFNFNEKEREYVIKKAKNIDHSSWEAYKHE